MILGYRFQKIVLRISKAGQRLYFNAESDKDYRYIKALCLLVGYEGALYGSTFGFRIEEKEILDESHEVHLLVSGHNQAPNSKMLLFERPVPINSSKIEGIYTDSAMQGLLGSRSYSPGGGLISRTEINIKKTYVSGREIVKYTSAVTDSGMTAVIGGPIGNGTGTPVPGQVLHYPYDVRVILFLTK